MELPVERPVDDKARRSAARQTAQWQRRLLPFMRATLTVLALSFFAGSYAQLYFLDKRIFDTPVIDTREATAVLSSTKAPLSSQEAFERPRPARGCYESRVENAPGIDMRNKPRAVHTAREVSA